ncbi:TetR/AcrR family transcriptional regulator [Paraburkholderia sp. DHOC27]|uniref:TetR/AcrR family transcriptional regulator n=1 Tax=Paraburkholderia sp. DHOC27 TaxID=2303330 RepID=UPI000E3E4A1C|nr:TetR/AcrR family transcriptional regulator [Paraburkholderia sp. DHOC27]RFU44714.1 TetR family transcriptional regulator [Paraburkholderia sp. DHOC27]
MPRPSHRGKILAEGLKVVHAQGFAGASVRDIVHAAGVPQGSFTNHFASKEAFGLEILDLYFSNGMAVLGETLRNDGVAPLRRLGDYLDWNIERIGQNDTRNGCLLGKFALEASDHSELIRQRIVEIFAEIQKSLEYCLNAAVKAGELPPDFDCNDIAGFIVASMQGAFLLAKTQRNVQPVVRLKHLLFSRILR